MFYSTAIAIFVLTVTQSKPHFYLLATSTQPARPSISAALARDAQEVLLFRSSRREKIEGLADCGSK